MDVNGVVTGVFQPTTMSGSAARIVGFAMSGSELACFMSHQSVWRLSVAQNRAVVVLEDDFKLQQNFVDSLNYAYIIKPSAAEVLLQMSEQIYEPVDHFIEHFRFHRQRVLAISPYSVEITGMPSTITERPESRNIRGARKFQRSLWRLLFRLKLLFRHPGARW
ncbi:MAG: glycosyltransferase family 25 protein [Hahellaceae bacterium]|nr:glycosyltransferase family 25 protein [Hahellaceae bacterium]